jgi:hypothetical protein
MSSITAVTNYPAPRILAALKRDPVVLPEETKDTIALRALRSRAEALSFRRL